MSFVSILYVPLLAGAAGTFFLLLLLGLGALAVTAALDKAVGKEKALLAYAVVIAILVILMGPEAPPKSGAKPKTLQMTVTEMADVDPFKHLPYDHSTARNIFEKHSDTRPLPPITLEQPPWIELAFSLPPTIPGPAPGHRRALRGTIPTMAADDGSAIAEIPDAAFVEYEPVPEDLFDWVMTSGKKFFIYIREIRDTNGRWVRRGEDGFDDLEWKLYRQGEGWEQLQVRFATIGPAKVAEKKLAREEWVKAIREGVAERSANDGEGGWFLKRSVDNLYREALEASGLRPSLENVTLGALKSAAARMAEVGKTGKEAREGWRRAVLLLERALDTAGAQGQGARADVLERLLEAHAALRNEDAILHVLSEYAEANPSSSEPWKWLGDFMLEIGIPDAAEAYQTAALERNRTDGGAHIGHGRALTFDGEHDAALEAFRRARTTEGAKLFVAEALLRLGKLDDAKREVESVLSSEPDNARATLVRGAVYYALGDLDTARAAFERAATAPDASMDRAQACYDLGLTCFRLGQSDAALAAFDACRKALERGSSPGPFPDESVSPSLGEALVALGCGQADRVPTAIERARREAPGNAYVELLAAMVASREGNVASAARALEAALRMSRDYQELDGWLAQNYLLLAEQQVSTGADAEIIADAFGRALAFAVRSAAREQAADKQAFRAHLRLALIQLRAQHLPVKQRYESGLKTVEYVLQKVDRAQPAANALRGYCLYGLGGDENVAQCIRDFQKVLDDMSEEDTENPWFEWRKYAAEMLEAVKHWSSLEELTVTFPDETLPKEWEVDESKGVGVKLEEGVIVIAGAAKTDGDQKEDTVAIRNQQLFSRESIEEVSFKAHIPARKEGSAVNNITFGFQVISGSGRKAAEKAPGIGIFYDKSWLAFRVGGGQNKSFQDGKPLREGEGVEKRRWPENEWVEIRMIREDAERGDMVIYMRPEGGEWEELFRDTVGAFRDSRGKAEFWIGGWSNQSEKFDVEVKDIRVVRKTR